MSIEHPDYSILASRIIVSNHHKNTSPSFSETIQTLYNNVDNHNNPIPLVSEELYNVVQKNKEKLNTCIDYQRDYLFDYFGFKTLERAYLLRINKKIIERPQHMWMRVAIGIHGHDIKEVLQTYDLLSRKYLK
jgi:ribonucleotide reductase alpha subunit